MLRPAEWSLIAPMMSAEFGNMMPIDPAQAAFLAAFADEKLAGFVHIERLFHAHCLYVAPEYRHTRAAYHMMHGVDARIPAGHSAIVLTDTEEVEDMLRRMGARDAGAWRLWRKDY